MIYKFKASVNHAVKGAALAGDAEFVNYLIDRGASLNIAVEYIAFRGDKLFTYDLLQRGANPYYAELHIMVMKLF